MNDIIAEHLKLYPEMEVTDVLKLIYQSVFGGGHMISNGKESEKRLEDEYEVVKNHLPKRDKTVENLGNGMCRVYLNAFTEGISASTLNKMFVISANRKKGRIEELEAYLKEFQEGIHTGYFSFSLEETQRTIENWRKDGYPAISHSEHYRSLYRPAYRVVDGCYGEYFRAILKIEELLKQNAEKDCPLVVIIDGMAGSGKSTMGACLRELYDCNLFHMDDYFLQPYQRTNKRLETPGGNVDYERFQKEIYEQLALKHDFTYQKFDCSTGMLGEHVSVTYKKLNIIEGAYGAHPYFGQRGDLVFFKKISKEEQLERISRRNGERMLKRFVEEWIPMEQRYFEAYSIEEKAISI